MGIFNQFPKYHQIDDALAEHYGRKKTITFAILYLTALIIIIVFYAQETYIKQIDIDYPSLSEYSEIKQYRPTCDCEQTSISLGTFMTFTYENDTLCNEASSRLTICHEDAPCQASPVYGFLTAIARFCDISRATVQSARSQLLSEELSSDSVIAQNALTQRIDQKKNAFDNVLSTAMLTPLEFLKAYLAMDKPLLYSQERVFSTQMGPYLRNLIVQSNFFNDSDCDCSTSWSCSRNVPDDSASTKVLTKCSILDTMLAADTDLVTKIEFWEQSKTMFGFGQLAASYKFSSTNFGGSSFTEAIKQGFMVNREIAVDYASYYNACKPESCTYYKESKRSAIDIIAILSGLVAGIASVLKPIVDACWGVFEKRQRKGQKIAAPGERDAMHMESGMPQNMTR